MARNLDELFAGLARRGMAQLRTGMSAAFRSVESTRLLALHTLVLIATVVGRRQLVTRSLAAVIRAGQQLTALPETRARDGLVTGPGTRLVSPETRDHHGDLARWAREALVLPAFLLNVPGPDRLGNAVRLDLRPDLGVTQCRTDVSAPVVRQIADLATRRTDALVAFVGLAFGMMADGWDLAHLVAVRGFDLLDGAAGHGDLAAAAAALYDDRAGARVAGTTVTGSRALVFATVQSVVAHLLARVEVVL